MAYLKVLVSVKDPDKIKKLPHGLRGRPLKLGEYDGFVKQDIHKLQLAGGIVNCSVVVAATKGIVEHLNPASLREHGGDINID